MDFDLKVSIPQSKFEKVLRIITPLVTINQLEIQIRDRIPDLPLKLTYHLDNDPNTNCLDISRSLKYYGFGDFSQENKVLYIFYSEFVAVNVKPNLLINPKVSTETKDSTNPVKESVNKQKKKKTSMKKEMKPDDILITIVDPFFATNHMFLVNPLIKISELVEFYKQRIDWGTRKGKLGLASFLTEETYNSSLTIINISKESELTFYAQEIEPKCKQNKRSRASSISSDEGGCLEVIEKKVKKEAMVVEKENVLKNGNQKKARMKKVPSNESIDIEEIPATEESSLKSTPTQMLAQITKSFDTLLTLNKVGEKSVNKEQSFAELYTKASPFIIEEDADE